MEYKLISHRIAGFNDRDLSDIEGQIERELEGSNTEPLGGPQITELPNGYQITQAVLVRGSENDYRTGTSMGSL